MNEKLQSIAKQASEDLLALIKDGEKSILEAWSACEQEAIENEQKPKFKLAFGITLDLDADKMETALSWGVKHKLSVDRTIPDPNQTFMSVLDGVGDEALRSAAAKVGGKVRTNVEL